MRNLILGAFFLVVIGAQAGNAAQARDAADQLRWQRHAGAVSIIRDTWGIAHIYGESDADAVFGMIYAQAEDDFNRVERNYLTALGWLAQADGEGAVFSDLRERLFVDPARLQRNYRVSPEWLKALMTAWADGLNYFLSKHPAVRPKVIRRFEPSMALSFTEGSIGGDIEKVDLGELESFYAPAARSANAATLPDPAEPLPGGSNGFAIAPSRSATGHALLYINPHTSYYFRSELQMVSGQGLDVYGAVTRGQFFVYQGFNSHNGWMHTSYGGDAVDEYAETLVKSGGLRYEYGVATRKLTRRHIIIAFRQGNRLQHRAFNVYFSHHGPIVRRDGEHLIAIKLLEDPVPALSQSYLRTKTTHYQEFLKTQDLRTDTSNNTVYADSDGTIAYFHGNFIPRRDPKYDFTRPVDGSNPATEWHGAHEVSETITLLNPATGWIQNTNNWPFSAAGAASPKREDYPAYMWTRGENPRGVHAVEVLHDIHDVTLDRLIAAGYDSHLTAFDTLLPPLFDAYDGLSTADARRADLKPAIEVLKSWDRRTSADSVSTGLAIFWGQALIDRESRQAREAGKPIYDYLVAHVTDSERIEALTAAVNKLNRDFDHWATPWGEINRFQRLTDDIVQPFDDSRPSLPVGFASSTWGALASFEAVTSRSTKKLYASVGNSFVAAVEFGPTVRAKAIMSGGESGNPSSPHFVDQALLFTTGQLRDVWFTRADVLAHAERMYHP